MAKKLKKKISRKKEVVKTEKDMEIIYLQRLAELSKRAANGASESLDDLFRNQADRLIKKAQKLKEKQ